MLVLNVQLVVQESVPEGIAPAVAVSQFLPPRLLPSQTSPESSVPLPQVVEFWQRVKQVFGAVPVHVQRS